MAITIQNLNYNYSIRGLGQVHTVTLNDYNDLALTGNLVTCVVHK